MNNNENVRYNIVMFYWRKQKFVNKTYTYDLYG